MKRLRRRSSEELSRDIQPLIRRTNQSLIMLGASPYHRIAGCNFTLKFSLRRDPCMKPLKKKW
jgi:hypothetical protein